MVVRLRSIVQPIFLAIVLKKCTSVFGTVSVNVLGVDFVAAVVIISF